MGNCGTSQSATPAATNPPSAIPPHENPKIESHASNVHVVNPDIKVHTVISSELDYDHKTAMNLKLGEVNDEQLLAEVARRKLDIHDRITDSMVKETYSVGKVLGHGASGEVYAVTHKVTGKKFACKVVKKNANMNDAQSMSTEIEIMKRIRHRNIVSTYELYETPKCLWIILELVDGGDLYHFLANAEGYNEVIASRQMKQALAGIHYLHSLGVVHRDLKLDNILILGSVQACEVKIADFGLSALVHLDEDGYDAESSAKRKRYTHLTEMWGTVEYFAPEVINQAYGPQADVWALGCVLYEMLCGEQAFPAREGDKKSTHYARICRGEYDVTKPIFKQKISAEAKDLLAGMLCVDPTKRLSASECLQHPWITGKGHSDAHVVPLPEVQHHMLARIERRKRKQH